MGFWKQYFNDLLCECAPDNRFAQDAIEAALRTDPSLQVTGQFETDVKTVMAKYDTIIERYRQKMRAA